MSSTLRIGGLASGIDTESIVKQMMSVQRLKVTKLEQQKQVLTWQQEDYRAINTSLRSFLDTISTMRLQSTYLTKSTKSSNESVVTVTGNSTALDGTHTVKVDQLTRGASVTSGASIGSNSNFTTLNSQFGTSYGTLDFEVNDVVFKVDASKDSINTLINRINSNSAAGVSINTTTAASDTQAQVQELRLADSALTEGMVITIGDKKVALWDSSSGKYADEAAAKAALNADFAYDIDGATAADIISAIETDVAPTGATLTASGSVLTITSQNVGVDNAVSTSVTGGKAWTVRASYDQTLDKFFLSTNTTGQDQHIKITDNILSQRLQVTNGSGDLDTASLTDFPDGDDGPKNIKGAYAADGRNADVTIDGLNITQYTSNQFTLNGVTYNLLNTSGGSDVNITVQQDTDAVFDQIVKFIDSYNNTVKAIEDKFGEERYKDYSWPLPQEQLDQLTDDQQKDWEEMARSGMLRNDSILRSIRDKFRSAMNAIVPGVSGGYESGGKTVKTDRLSQIGITTTVDYWSAELVIDETKLRQAIENDSQGVMDLFTKSSDNYDEKGIAKRLYDDVNEGIDKIIDKAGGSTYAITDDSFIGKNIKELTEDVDDWEDRLEVIEERYWSQFTAMEKAIQQMNSQSSWLTQFFSSGSS